LEMKRWPGNIVALTMSTLLAGAFWSVSGSANASGLTILKEVATAKKQLARRLLNTLDDLEALTKDPSSEFLKSFARRWSGGEADVERRLHLAITEIQRMSKLATETAVDLEKQYNTTRVKSIESAIREPEDIVARRDTRCENREKEASCKGRARSQLLAELRVQAKQKFVERIEGIPSLVCTPSQLLSMIYLRPVSPEKADISERTEGLITVAGTGQYRGFIIDTARERLLVFGECGTVISSSGEYQLPKMMSVEAEHEADPSPNCRSQAEIVATIKAESKLLDIAKSKICSQTSWKIGDSEKKQVSILCSSAGLLPPLRSKIEWLGACKAKVTVSVQTRKLFP
jgi:hypothetical protein